MISQTNKELLNSISTSPYGKALQEFLDEQYDIINDVQSCLTWEETLGRKLALQTIEKLFSFMAVKKESSKGKNQYY